MPLTLVLGTGELRQGRRGPRRLRGRGAARRAAGRADGDDARHYTRELAADGVVLGSVLTFRARPRDRAAGRIRRSAAVRLQRERVLATLLGARASSSRSAPSADSPGFRSAAGELIAELERELITPQRFVAALRAWSAQDPRNARLRPRSGGDLLALRPRARAARSGRPRAVRVAGARRAARAAGQLGRATRCSSTGSTS